MPDLLLALVHLIDSLLKLGFELRDFEHSKSLSLLHDVADINADLAHVSADFGMDIDDLIRLKLSGQR